MKEVLSELVSSLASGRRAIYTALVETRGSTPQKPGAAMLVFEDGSQVGTLGGGCVEAEVKRTALEQLSSPASRIVSFQLNHDYGWDDGLICGGRMTMLIDPVLSDSQREFYTAYQRVVREGAGCTEAVMLPSREEAPGATSISRSVRRFLFDEEGNLILGTSPLPPPEVTDHLRPLADRPRPYVAGGVAFLPQLPRCRLLIVGAGHVGQQLAAYASEVDFDVWVADDRELYCNPERIPSASKHLVGPFEEVLPDLPVDGNTFCVIVTRGHNHDEEALLHLIRHPARYLGMIGSRRKIRMIFEDLQAQGIPAESFERVHAPVGFDIGSQTVPEIAISIVAELISCRNLPGASGGPACEVGTHAEADPGEVPSG